MDDKRAFICLNLVPGVGPIKVNRLIEIFGSATAIFEKSAKELKGVEGIGPKLAEEICKGLMNHNPDDELRMAERAGVTILSRDCPEYPEFLREIADPPLVLYVRGNVSCLNNPYRSIAMVGSRRPSHYGVKMAESLSVSAVTAGWTTISGLAIGIDTATHRATVDAGGTTISVLGSGLGRLYPQENLELARRVCEKGAVISEFPMTFPPDRRSFPMRNRIISGMSCGTIVVEAGLKSGTLITANQANDQGRNVFAVPGRANEPGSRGCHSLIRDGAKLIENFADVLEEYNNLTLFDAAKFNIIDATKGKKEVPRTLPALTLSETEQKIVKFLSLGEATVDNMVEELEIAVGKAFATLIEMETKKLVKPLPGRRYILLK